MKLHIQCTTDVTNHPQFEFFTVLSFCLQLSGKSEPRACLGPNTDARLLSQRCFWVQYTSAMWEPPVSSDLGGRFSEGVIVDSCSKLCCNGNSYWCFCMTVMTLHKCTYLHTILRIVWFVFFWSHEWGNRVVFCIHGGCFWSHES